MSETRSPEEALVETIREVGVDAAALVRLVREAPGDKVGSLVPAIQYAGRLDADTARTTAALLAMMVVAVEREHGTVTS